MPVSIHDVAKRAGVSIATVSRALQGVATVDPGLRERVVEAAKELDYRPNAVARALRTSSTRTIGMVVTSILNPFFTEVARAAEDAARLRGYTLVLGNSDEEPDRESHYLRVFAEQRVDGFIVAPTGHDDSTLAALAESHSPVVVIDRRVEGIDVPTVRVDGSRALDELAEHLAEQGWERVAMIAGPRDREIARLRATAFRDAMTVRGVPVAADLVLEGPFTREHGRDAARRLLKAGADCLITVNNSIAEGAVEAIAERGLQIGRDIGFASYDDVPWFRLINPAVTAISQPCAQIGAAAIDGLVALIEGRAISDVTLEAQLVVRASSVRVVSSSPSHRPGIGGRHGHR